jgi:hypothetical protein
MKKLLTIIAVNTVIAIGAGSAIAQTSGTPSVVAATELTLNDQQAIALIKRKVYSSDAQKLGEVAAVQRDSSGKVTELHADIGGFLGLGETRVSVLPNQFHVAEDKVVLNLTANQAKTLPHIEKK